MYNIQFVLLCEVHVCVGLLTILVICAFTGLISRQATAIVGQFVSADSKGFKILNMFDRGSLPTITESVV